MLFHMFSLITFLIYKKTMNALALLSNIDTFALKQQYYMEHHDKIFEKLVYSEKLIKGKEFNACTFIKCDFSSSSFNNSKFLDCTFEECNLSLMSLGGCTLNSAHFKACKVLGVNFSECMDFLFSVSFENCILDYASFQGKKMPKTT